MLNFRIRRANAADAAELSLVGGASFLETFADEFGGRDIVAHVEEKLSQAAFRQLIEDEGARAWLVEQCETNAPLGYALVTTPELPVPTTDRDMELRRIYFLSRCHGTGAAAALLHEIITDVRDMGAYRLLLGVYAGNDRAAGFYSKHGFKKIGDRAYKIGSRTYDDHIYALDLN
jgi:ribosomal protein S18 acetylase RimI-like enzyme